MNAVPYYYLGPQGSFSYRVLGHIAPDGTYIPQDSFADIVQSLMHKKNSRGLLPVENTNSSSVHECIDLLYVHPLHIVGEAYMKIRLGLWGMPGTRIADARFIYSHPQAIAQCAPFLKEYPALQTVETRSTSEAVRIVSEKGDNLHIAIAGNDAIEQNTRIAMIYRLDSLPENTTRWLILSTSSETALQHADKMTVIFRVPHVPGSLVTMLSRIAEHGGNLTKIESRPVPGTNWEYAFWVDIEIPSGTHSEFGTLFSRHASTHRVVGLYQRGSIFQS